jgi:predicted AlkP superfamily phosphohydrolase/phosphomutase
VLDQVQRRFWHFMDSSHAAYPGPNEFGETILEFHQILDEALAEIVNLLDDRMGLLLVSEHGTRALETYFAVTSWLETSGFLAMKDEKAATPPTLAGIGAEVYALLRALRRSGLDWLPKIVSSRVTAHALPVTIPSADLPSRVDWAATRVFCPAEASGGVRVNLRGREPHGIVAPEDFAAVCEEVRAALVALVDPATGRHVVRDVHRHHAIASGTFAADAADLLIETADGFGLVEAAGSGPLAPAVTSDSRCTGQPARAGMIVLAGPMARRGAVAPALDIRDVTRTLLHLLGLPTPADPDGAIATSVLAEAHALTIDTDRSADLATRSLERTMEGPGFL